MFTLGQICNPPSYALFSLHGCIWQLWVLVLSAVPPVFLGCRWHAARETLCQQVLVQHSARAWVHSQHRSATAMALGDGSRSAKALLSGGKVTATQLEVAGMAYRAGAV